MDLIRQPVGVNTFGPGRLLSDDFEGTVQQLKEAGFTAIEPLVVFPEALGMPESMMVRRLSDSGQLGVFWPEELAKERIAYLRSEGFAVEGIHLGLVGMVPDRLKQVLPSATQFAEETGLSYLVHSPKLTSVREMEQEAEGFRFGKEILSEKGIELLFHCHYHEFRNDNGVTPFDCLLKAVPDLRIELDVGWAHFAGINVTELMNTYRDRIAVIHFKDLTEDAGEENITNCFTAVGNGTLPLKEIMNCAETLQLSYTGLIIDQDNSRGDMIKDLRDGVNNILSCIKQ